MYNQGNDDRGRRYNGRQGSGYNTNRSNDSRRDPYSGSWRTQEEDRYEDDRFHLSRTGRQNDEDDYGPFSNIYDNNSDRRGDFDTRYNHTGNYYYNDNRRSGNDRSDEARGQSLSDVFNGGRSRGNSDREYFTSYRSGNENRYGSDPHYSLYGSEDSARYNRNHYNDDDRNFFERTGDRIRETWNDWTNNDRRNERDSRNDYNSRNEDSRRNEDYRNLRDYSDRDKSYNGYSTAFNKRRRYNEGYLY
jgi:hypothetical protein